MITSISVKELDTIKHSTNKYAILSMCFLKINSDDILIKTIIIREIHLVNDLKTNLLINNDIFDSEKVDIFNSTKSIIIDSYGIIISITIRIEIESQIKSIHAVKAFTIFFKFECLISIHHISFLFDKDFFFELVETGLIIYAHLVNLKTFFILILNNRDQSMKIIRNFRIKTIKEFDSLNVY